ncbi:hypothetical protein BDR07DRAFT_1421080 [Suillus spraguei]|nr:hypothetical protein BDR07DRAFT_1421080 [Suillus spraguei]
MTHSIVCSRLLGMLILSPGWKWSGARRVCGLALSSYLKGRNLQSPYDARSSASTTSVLLLSISTLSSLELLSSGMFKNSFASSWRSFINVVW